MEPLWLVLVRVEWVVTVDMGAIANGGRRGAADMVLQRGRS